MRHKKNSGILSSDDSRQGSEKGDGVYGHIDCLGTQKKSPTGDPERREGEADSDTCAENGRIEEDTLFSASTIFFLHNFHKSQQEMQLDSPPTQPSHLRHKTPTLACKHFSLLLVYPLVLSS